SNAWSQGCSALNKAIAAIGLLLVSGSAALAESHEAGGEANLKLPDLSKVSFLGVNGHKLLLFGLLVCVFGLLFGLAIYRRLKDLPVHRTMKEISELIYETCKTYPIYHTPLEAGMSIGMMLISVELLMMLLILLFIPGAYAGPCFIGFAIGESLGAAALRIAGGIFTKIADIGSDLM